MLKRFNKPKHAVGGLVINKLISKSVPYIAAAVLALTGMQAFGATATI